MAAPTTNNHPHHNTRGPEEEDCQRAGVMVASHSHHKNVLNSNEEVFSSFLFQETNVNTITTDNKLGTKLLMQVQNYFQLAVVLNGLVFEFLICLNYIYYF